VARRWSCATLQAAVGRHIKGKTGGCSDQTCSSLTASRQSCAFCTSRAPSRSRLDVAIAVRFTFRQGRRCTRGWRHRLVFSVLTLAVTSNVPCCALSHTTVCGLIGLWLPIVVYPSLVSILFGCFYVASIGGSIAMRTSRTDHIENSIGHIQEDP